MSFLERARAGYENLAGRADQALDAATAGKELGEIDRYYRDLGVLAYLEATGRDVDPTTRERLESVLRSLEARGAIRDFRLQTGGGPAGGAPPAPPPGGSDGVPQPPPERAGRHGDFLDQPRQAPPTGTGTPSGRTWARSDPDETTGPRPTPPPPSVGGTWGPPAP